MTEVATYGIDLASRPPRTGVCWISWFDDGSAWADSPAIGGRDHDLLDRMLHRDIVRVGIDAPFGWPVGFLEALIRYQADGEWSGVPLGDYSFDTQLRWRATDRLVHEHTGLSPLSVSTDKIGAVTMRCARLLDEYWRGSGEPVDRSGAGRIVEVYPAVALRAWNISPHESLENPGSYKGTSPAARARRENLVDEIVGQTCAWLDLGEKAQIECKRYDHCLDALLCALIARAVDIGHVRAVQDPVRARLEGWIAVPDRSLSELGSHAPSTEGNQRLPIR